MSRRLFLALFCVLIIVRAPSLVQPMGADQGLYSYVGERILDGGLPYRDAWDQKPPAIHYTYAGMRAIRAHDSVVPASDLLVACAIAALLVPLGAALASAGAGQAAALLFLFLSNPSFQRLAGVRIEAQCETFIALFVTSALVLLIRRSGPGLWTPALAGACLGLAFSYKYNAIVYAPVAMFALALRTRVSFAHAAAIAAGFCLPPLLFLVRFWQGGAARDLYDATILYNLRYSGETYRGPADMLRYLLVFPIDHARIDALWLVGGAGCAVLLAASFRERDRLFAPAWVAAACLVIAINGSRGLPQYFVQAAPALALAAAWAGAVLRTRTLVNLAAIAIVAVGVWRVNNFQKLVENTWHDTRYLLGHQTTQEHLARYGDPGERKYSALAVARLGEFVRSRTSPSDRVLIFGFSCGAYVEADRASASRFFWSRPVIAGFNDGLAGYGVSGLLSDLQRTSPAVVALQLRDWAPDVDDSAHFFHASPALAEWLRTSYDRVDGPPEFDTWVRRGGGQ